MTPIPLALAGLLGGAVLSKATSKGGAVPGGVSPDDFSQLLDQAKRGELSTGRGISLAPDIEMDDATRAAVGDAIDRLEASGAATGAVIVDGTAYRVDVQTRAVIEPIKAGQAIDVDRVVVADRGDEDGDGSPAVSADDLLSRLGRAG